LLIPNKVDRYLERLEFEALRQTGVFEGREAWMPHAAGLLMDAQKRYKEGTMPLVGHLIPALLIRRSIRSPRVFLPYIQLHLKEL
jgi:hypothetical protein